jgi:hypothetical protein
LIILPLGSEGQKDFHATLWLYSPNPPNSLVYDFACGSHEYNSNNESRFFSDVRVYHDIFRGWKHLCSISFRLHRIRQATSWNSPLAEQWNDYIKPKIRAPQLS